MNEYQKAANPNYNRSMDQRIYHGNMSPADLASALVAHFNRGNLRVQQVSDGAKVVVQISTRDRPSSGGQTALSIILQKVEDGVAVQVGQQAWLGVAASLGISAISLLHNPLSILNRLDDIAQDVEHLKMSEEVWKVIEMTARAYGASYELSERLKRLVCEYCGTANEIGTPSCIACGAPMGYAQPSTCRKCGFVLLKSEKICPDCKSLQ